LQNDEDDQPEIVGFKLECETMSFV